MTGGRLLGQARDGALKYGRMTCEDVAELVAVFAQVGSRQARDALHALRGQLAQGRREDGPPRGGA